MDYNNVTPPPIIISIFRGCFGMCVCWVGGGSRPAESARDSPEEDVLATPPLVSPPETVIFAPCSMCLISRGLINPLVK